MSTSSGVTSIARDAKHRGNAADDQAGDDEGDGVRQPQRPGDDRDQAGQPEQAHHQFDRIERPGSVHRSMVPDMRVGRAPGPLATYAGVSN